MNRQHLRTEFNQLLRRLDKRFVGGIYKALKDQISSFTSDLRKYGSSYAQSRLSVTLLNEKVATVIMRIHREAGIALANQTLRDLNKVKTGLQVKHRTFGHSEEWTIDIQNYFSRYLLEKSVVPISETTRDIILRTLQKAIEEGWTIEEIVQKLESSELTRYRAQMIVRTETVRAANYGILIGADKYEYEVEKEWLSIKDNRTRHSHLNIDGQKREIDEAFGNGLLFPGDPEGPGSETINCRCRIVMVVKRDSKGRTIPKKPRILAIGTSLREQFAA